MVEMTWPQFLRRECSYKQYRTRLTGQETTVLATLLIRGPRPTPVAILADALWGDDPEGGREDMAGGVGAVIRHLRAKLPGAIGGRAGFGWFINKETMA